MQNFSLLVSKLRERFELMNRQTTYQINLTPYLFFYLSTHFARAVKKLTDFEKSWHMKIHVGH